MKEPWQWEEEDIETLIREQRKEDLRLEYKRSDALGRTETARTDISKDVSAMANSAGGAIIYGIDEQRKSNGPIQLDKGVDPISVTPEWLEQVIDSGIQQRIDGIQIHPIQWQMLENLFTSSGFPRATARRIRRRIIVTTNVSGP